MSQEEQEQEQEPTPNFNLQKVFGRVTVRVSRCCLEGVWKGFRRGLEGVWKVSGKFLEGVW